MAVVLVTPSHLTPLRREMRKLLLPGERELHFKQEKDPRRRKLADRISPLAADATIYTCPCGRFDEPARQACLMRLTEDLAGQSAHRMVLDSREGRDKHDRMTIKRTLDKHGTRPQLVYEHLSGPNEPLLWIADAVAWCWGAGGAWRRRMAPIISRVEHLMN
jgi:hypothetical protein